MELFKVFQEREAYFEKLIQKEEGKSYLYKQIAFIFLFNFLYGVVMGSHNGWLQAVVTGVKIPALIFLSLSICFPAFYVIQYMLGSRMTILQMINMTLSGFLVFSTIMLSFSPIVIFFMITGDNYSFLKLLHVAIIGFSGIFGMKIILDALKYSCERSNTYPRVGLRIFKFWVFVFAFVGAQLAWNLRPFVGAKELPFELFREKEGNFYLAVGQSISSIFVPEQVDSSDEKSKDHESTQVIQTAVKEAEKVEVSAQPVVGTVQNKSDDDGK